MTKQIKLSELKADINAGMKREALRNKYTDGNNNQLNLILKQAGLKIRKFKATPAVPKFELVDDTAEWNTANDGECTTEEIREVREVLSEVE